MEIHVKIFYMRAKPQDHVIVKLNLLIFKVLAGYGCLFFGYAL